MTDIRVGIGYDLHRLVSGRPLRLGGLTIPFEKGLLGHSDGDVLLHAVTDAMLGACNLPDIGDLFPDTDPQYKDADSRKLLAAALDRVRATGYTPGNLDCVVHAEQPRLHGFKEKLAGSIAQLVGISAGRVNVKAKTNEGLGPVGEGAAIAATVVATVVRG